MEGWLQRTATYVPSWIDHQLRSSEQIGCLLAIVHEGELVLEYAAGSANLATGELLTPRHRFRIDPTRRASPPPASCSSANGAW